MTGLGMGIRLHHRQHGSGGGGGGSVAPAISIGLLTNPIVYYGGEMFSPDLFQGGFRWEWVDGSNNIAEVPGTLLDANRELTGVPVGTVAVRRSIITPPDSTVRTISWSGTGVTGITCPNANATISNFNGTTKTATLTPSAVMPNGGPVAIHFACTANPPTGVTVLASGETAWGISNYFSTNYGRFTSAGGPIRNMKGVGVENNQGVTGFTAFPTVNLTRNALHSAEWYANDGTGNGGYPNDGTPGDWWIGTANTINRPPWDNYAYNYTNAQVDVRATYAVTNLSSGLTYYAELQNEPWNSGYVRQWSQMAAEATSEGITALTGGSFTFTGSISGSVLTVTAVTGTPFAVGTKISGGGMAYAGTQVQISSLGTGTGGTGTYNLNVSPGTISSTTLVGNSGFAFERSIEKCASVMDRIKAVWDASARSPKPTLKRLYSMQNHVGTPSQAASLATNILNYQSAAMSAPLKSKIDVLASAPYARPDAGTTQSQNPFTQYTVAQVIAQMKVNFAVEIANAVAIRAAAQALGVGYGCYEWGTETFFSDNTFHANLYSDSGMYDLYLWMLQTTELNLAGIPVCVSFEVAGISSSGPPGLLQYTSQTPIDGTNSTQKAKATIDFIGGKRVLAASPTTVTVQIPATNGTVVGTAVRTVYNSTWSLANNDGGRLAIDASTGVITIANAGLYSTQETRSFTLRESHPGDATGYHDTVISYNVNVTYRAIKVHITAAGDGGSKTGLAEFEAYATVGGANIIPAHSPAVTATSVIDGSHPVSNACNGSEFDNGWESAAQLPGTPQDLIVDFGATASNWISAPAQYGFMPRGGNVTETPGTFTISLTQDDPSGTPTWTQVLSRSGITYTGALTKFTPP